MPRAREVNAEKLHKPPDRTWRDHLLTLLHVAAELEHCLMVQYLYAAYSLGGVNVPADLRVRVQHWQNLILTVAREEMGHFMCIQNVLCLLGGPLNFHRSDYPWDSDYYPFAFRLEPLTINSLGCYVFAEMGPAVDPSDIGYPPTKRSADFERDLPRIVDAARNAAGWSGTPHHVGVIYEAIIDILSDPLRIPDSAFNAASYAFQASWDEWGKGNRPGVKDTGTAADDPRHRSQVIVAQMATRTEAIRSLKQVASQGEAPHLRGRLTEEPSHFDRFFSIYRELEEFKDCSTSRNCPINPTVSDASPNQTRIECEVSREWAMLFNLRYRMLLGYIGHTYKLQRSTNPNVPSVRAGALHRAFGEMYNIRALADILFRLPLTDDPDDPRRAGPPFEMPYTLDVPPTQSEQWDVHRDLHHASRDIATNLMKTAHGSARPYLATLANLDQQAIDWIGGMRFQTSINSQ